MIVQEFWGQNILISLCYLTIYSDQLISWNISVQFVTTTK